MNSILNLEKFTCAATWAKGSTILILRIPGCLLRFTTIREGKLKKIFILGQHAWVDVCWKMFKRIKNSKNFPFLNSNWIFFCFYGFFIIYFKCVCVYVLFSFRLWKKELRNQNILQETVIHEFFFISFFVSQVSNYQIFLAKIVSFFSQLFSKNCVCKLFTINFNCMLTWGQPLTKYKSSEVADIFTWFSFSLLNNSLCFFLAIM